MKKYKIGIKVLPGEKTDGSGQVCIHLFVQDPKGIILEPSVMQVVDDKLVSRPARGRLACNPTKSVKPVTRSNGITDITLRSDDPRAITCPKCKLSSEYISMMSKCSN